MLSSEKSCSAFSTSTPECDDAMPDGFEWRISSRRRSQLLLSSVSTSEWTLPSIVLGFSSMAEDVGSAAPRRICSFEAQQAEPRLSRESSKGSDCYCNGRAVMAKDPSGRKSVRGLRESKEKGGKRKISAKAKPSFIG